MSPTTEKTRSLGAEANRFPEAIEQAFNAQALRTERFRSDGLVRVPDDMERAAVRVKPEEALEEEEHNPWRNHEDDQHKWLGLLLAAVGFGALGYLVAGI